MNLSLAFITARPEPLFNWFTDSLIPQIRPEDDIEIIFCSLRCNGTNKYPKENGDRFGLILTEPKPNVWQGKHRLTPQDMWAKSNACNTAICLAKYEWLAFVDDRCVLIPGWLDSIREAMAGNYAVAGSYEKRSGIAVKDGVITNPGTVIGLDPRRHMIEPTMTYGGEWYGCNFAVPLEWCLEMNGFCENCDGLRYEDTIFGNRLCANGHITKFDPRMKVIQDRTQPDAGVPVGWDKGSSPADKSHRLLELYGHGKISINPFDIRVMRENVQAGNSFPIPTKPDVDWYDNQPLKEMVVP